MGTEELDPVVTVPRRTEKGFSEKEREKRDWCTIQPVATVNTKLSLFFFFFFLELFRAHFSVFVFFPTLTSLVSMARILHCALKKYIFLFVLIIVKYYFKVSVCGLTKDEGNTREHEAN